MSINSAIFGKNTVDEGDIYIMFVFLDLEVILFNFKPFSDHDLEDVCNDNSWFVNHLVLNHWLSRFYLLSFIFYLEDDCNGMVTVSL